ncbi:pyridoxal phosphate homeostasis protein isoform X2 [Exaiptasia diaphana]|uniref:Pyridoxal phosphate homeostasis protein n=1 Tax=Exaiptasia diaphana TaxID=2652724 RepID=A0A913YHA0_EXADI|nr:pyridoxal phosphate homeostasis protein isoform X2 [Exaiptasia diaphana]
MKRIMAMKNVGPALKQVLNRMHDAVEKRPESVCKAMPRLVAVSKTKPVDLIVEAYEHGQRHFGENYVQELAKKAADPRIQQLKDLKWHFIGHLQRNKSIPNLYMVETINSERLAQSLNSSWGKVNSEPLNVMVEVNTSDEETKKGCRADDCITIVEYVIKNCPNLKFVGLMTIGQYNYDWEQCGPNPDFICLIKYQEIVCKKFNLTKQQVELSMGMSSDFDKAIVMGSTNVRVGSTIFGEREPKLKQPAAEERPAIDVDPNTTATEDLVTKASANLDELSLT